MPVIVPDANGPIIVTTTGGGSGGSGPVGVGISELVRRIRMLLEDYPLQDQTTFDITTITQPSVTVSDGTLWDTGVRMEFDDATGEQVVIGSVTGSTLNNMRRGAYGTTAALHPLGTYILREPRFGYQQITDALSQVVGWFQGSLWVQTTASLTPQTTGNYFYAVPDDFVGWISVTQLDSTGNTEIEYGAPGSGLPVLVKRGVPGTLSTNGMALWIPTLLNTTHSLKLTYGANVTTGTLEDGLVAAAAVYGACSLLIGAKDVLRTGQDTSQGDTTVPAGATLRTSQWFQQEYQMYLEHARLDLIHRGRLHR